jgi:1-acyl-sn-glycerol-3-phosphate acyltransferase
LDAIRARIHDLAMDLLHVAPDDIMLAPPHTVLKTSSGKIRRAACRDLYDRGALVGTGPRAVWVQVARLVAGGALGEARRWSRGGARALYAGYAWAVFGVGISAALVAASVVPSPRARWRAVRALARGGLRLAGVPLVIRGALRGPAVCVVNHASYLDAVVLAASLPEGGAFVAKRELAEAAPAGFFLRRLGTEFVERFDRQKGVEDTGRLVEAARAGRSLIVFPEGTFGRAAGLRQFRMGAFMVAAQSGTPVVPVALRGTRSILRDGSWFPRRGTVSVVIGEPVAPQGTDWAAARVLHDAARAHILQWCGEPDLSGG